MASLTSGTGELVIMVTAAKERQQRERRARAEAANNASASTSKEVSPKSDVSSLRTPHSAAIPSHYDGNRDPTRSDAGSQQGDRPPAIPIASHGPLAFSRDFDYGGFGAALALGLGHGLRLPDRPLQANKTGREISVKLNTFNVQQYPSKPIYQYDVVIGSGTEKRGLNKVCWNFLAGKKEPGPGWIFDGNRLAWSMTKLSEDKRYTVDTDEARGKTPHPDESKREKVKVNVRLAKTLDFAPLRGYLGHKNDFDVPCLEAINFLDHLMRESPAQKYTVQKRNFFARGKERTLLGGGVEAMKGVYASMRLAHPGHLSVNVDVANTTFWTETQLNRIAMQVLNTRDDNAQLSQLLKAGQGSHTPALVELNRMLGKKRVNVYTSHVKGVSKEESKKNPLKISSFLNKSAKQLKIKVKINKDGPEQSMTVFDYFQKKHNIRLQCPDLPLVEINRTIKGEFMKLPMELCTVLDNQRYPFKLSDKQTSEMIKFAVTLPAQRWQHIEEGKAMLDWGNDRYLANYGLKISDAPSVVKARLLPNPKVVFGQGSGAPTDPRTSGRWDLRGKKFFEPYKTPLNSWGICITPGRFAVNEEQVRNFTRVFITAMEGHGCKIQNKNPVIVMGSNDPGKNVETLFNTTGNSTKSQPQILFFIVPDKGTETYKRIKKSADCRYGVVSQVLQSAHVQKAQPQYCSNVAMKVNAKLGGTTCRAQGLKGSGSWFKVPTMIIGADVSHASPGAQGEDAASIAAMTMSFDRAAAKYIAEVDTNGQRIEMIMKENIDNHLKKMTQAWMSEVAQGKMPQHVIYVRDGVSEGQYAHVLSQEVRDMDAMFSSIDRAGARAIKYTIIMGSKRHHVRFFPEGGSGDRNNNPQPGTLVETAVTHPREYDFYLCAHSAIKGTARPVHYHVLRDDMKMPPEELQNMLYESSYQYMRSTTPVSLFPAAYYAHLAAYRGQSHLNKAAVSSSEDKSKTRTSSLEPTEVPKALPMPGSAIHKVMWYI